MPKISRQKLSWPTQQITYVLMICQLPHSFLVPRKKSLQDWDVFQVRCLWQLPLTPYQQGNTTFRVPKLAAPQNVYFTHFRDLDIFFPRECPDTSVLKAPVLLVMPCFFWRFCTTPAHHVPDDVGYSLGVESGTEGGIAAASIHGHFSQKKKGNHCYLFSFFFFFFPLKRQKTVIGTELQQLILTLQDQHPFSPCTDVWAAAAADQRKAPDGAA